MIITHRGNDQGPENSMKALINSIDTEIEGIEADVWLNESGDPMVLHGHDMGYLTEWQFPGERMFEWTTEALTDEIIDIGLGGRMPTLEQFLQESLRFPGLLLNFEVKGPLDPVTWMSVFDPIYDYDEACLKVILLIEKYDLASRTMISSFNPEIYESTIKMSMPPRKRDFIISILPPGEITLGYWGGQSLLRPLLRVSPIIPAYLRDRFGFMCPFNYANYGKNHERMVGITLYINDHFEPDVKRVKSEGRFFGSWIATETKESIEMWEKIFLDPSGIDLIFTNRPVPATKARNMLQPIEPYLEGTGSGKSNRDPDELRDDE